mgnify:CR=1 FL=1
MSKPPIKRGPRSPARSDARGASPRTPRPRRDDAGDAPPRKRVPKAESDDAPWRKPRAEGGPAGKPAGGFGKKPAGAFGKPGEGFGGKKAAGFFGKGKPGEERPARGPSKDGGFAPRARKPREEAPYARRERAAPAPQTAPDPNMPKREGDRIAKVMARAGLCSRRDAEIWIADGRVAVNGRVLDSANVVVAEGDRITVDGHPLAKRERTRLFLFHKPRGLVTTDRDPDGRETIFEAMPADLPRVVTIGRLDINTEGLLLLTNDGGLARVLELPSTGWLRRYRVRAHGETDQAKLDALRLGVTVDGVDYAGVEATLDRVQGSNVWLTMGLREGKNREVKRILEHLGLSVNRLIRLSYGPFQLGDLPEGGVEEVRPRVLREQLGPALAAEAGVDFESPLIERDESEERVEPRRRIAWRQEEPDAEAPRRKPIPAKRAHVSALRAERDEEKARMRSERSQTEDRHGRVVAVERRVRAEPEAEAPKKRKGPPRIAGERSAERGRDMPRGPRDAGRPATGRTRGAEGARERPDAARAFSRGPRREDGEGRAPRFNHDSAPPRARRFNDDGAPQRSERPYGATARGPRPEGGARFGKPRGEGFGGGDERPRPPRAPRGEGYEARPRAEGERTFRPRPDGERPSRFQRSEGGERPARAPRPEGERTFRPRPDGERPSRFQRPEGGERPARAPRPEGERTFRPRPDGERPSRFQRPEGGERPARGPRPEGERTFRPRPEGDRPSRFQRPEGGERPARAPRGEGKSFGGKPSGGKPFAKGPRREGGGFGGKPGGRPSGSRSGGKPFGGKPLGGKPGGRGPGRGPRRDG